MLSAQPNVSVAGPRVDTTRMQVTGLLDKKLTRAAPVHAELDRVHPPSTSIDTPYFVDAPQ